MIFTCLNCGNSGVTNRSNQRFCDYHCREKYRDKNRRPEPDFPRCRFNNGVECHGGACESCGWNPAVTIKRMLGRLGT